MGDKEVHDPRRDHDYKLIRKDVVEELEISVRRAIDKVLREELKNLKAALANDKKKKPKKKEKTKKTDEKMEEELSPERYTSDMEFLKLLKQSRSLLIVGKPIDKETQTEDKGVDFFTIEDEIIHEDEQRRLEKLKEEEKKPKKKKRKQVDLTKGRTMDSIFVELVKNNVMKEYPETYFSSYVGEPSFNAEEKVDQYLDPLPTMGDVRRSLKELTFLPFASEFVHTTIPLVRSILLIGPPKSGKRMLVDAICTETGSVMLDVSPSACGQSYRGGKEMGMLSYLLEKVGDMLQPTVFFLPDAEKPFMRKVPPADRLNHPKQFAKSLPKLIKKIKPGKRLLFIGTTNKPWEGNYNKMLRMFDRILYVPRTDRGTLHLYWQQLLLKHPTVDRNFDTSTLARFSVGYPIETINKVAKMILSVNRIIEFQSRPITVQEIVENLDKIGGRVTDEDEQKYLDFMRSKVPLHKLKFQRNEETLRLIEAEKKRGNK